MDRRQFNKTVAASIIGASFLPSTEAKTEYTLGAEGVEKLVGKRTLEPGEHIFGGLIDGKQPIAAFYHPHQTVYSWLWKINYEYIATSIRPLYIPPFTDIVDAEAIYATTIFTHQCLTETSQTKFKQSWCDLVWTDHWYRYPILPGGTKHEKLAPGNQIVYMQDKWKNFLFWAPNSHRCEGNMPSKVASLHLQNWPLSEPTYQIFKTMPYPAYVVRIN